MVLFWHSALLGPCSNRAPSRPEPGADLRRRVPRFQTTASLAASIETRSHASGEKAERIKHISGGTCPRSVDVARLQRRPGVCIVSHNYPIYSSGYSLATGVLLTSRIQQHGHGDGLQVLLSQCVLTGWARSLEPDPAWNKINVFIALPAKYSRDESFLG